MSYIVISVPIVSLSEFLFWVKLPSYKVRVGVGTGGGGWRGKVKMHCFENVIFLRVFL